MPKVSILVKGAVVATMLASGLVAGAGITFRLLDPIAAAQGAISHGMVGHGADRPAAQQAATGANRVIIDNFSFGPAALTVAAGTKVVWTNDDADPHTVTSEGDSKVLKSPPLDTGDSFAFTFDKPGTYRYFCSIHPHMQGTIVVQ